MGCPLPLLCVPLVAQLLPTGGPAQCDRHELKLDLQARQWNPDELCKDNLRSGLQLSYILLHMLRYLRCGQGGYEKADRKGADADRASDGNRGSAQALATHDRWHASVHQQWMRT